MSFEEIALTPNELKALKKSSREQIPIANHPRLKELLLVDEIENHVPGYAPVGTGFAVISNVGKNYLAYVSSSGRIRRKEHTHNWLITIFSTISGALLSDPLWKFIHWVSDLICGNS